VARLDVFSDRVLIRPRSSRRGIFVPTWEALYTELQPVRVVRRPLSLGIRFRRIDNNVITFRPARDSLQDGAEPVLAALRSAGANIEGGAVRQTAISESDPIDNAIWSRVVNTVVAAHGDNLAAHDDAYNRWPRELSLEMQRRAELYISFLLRHQLYLTIGDKITDADIHDTAVMVLPKANRLVKGTVSIYEEVFLEVLGRSRPDGQLKGAEIDVVATAALGALLGNDPDGELTAIQPYLAEYYRRHWKVLRSRELGIE
jgi:hypothetical protein